MHSTVVNTTTCYFSAGCNRTPHCLDWSFGNGLICYGTNHALAIYDPKDAIVIHTAAVHTNRVNCVRWVRSKNCNGDEDVELVSCSSDKTALIWRYGASDNANEHGSTKESCRELRAVCKLVGHSDVVNVVDALAFNSDGDGDRRLLVVTASSDSTLKIWTKRSTGDEIACDQTINLESHFAFDAKLEFHPKTAIPLLVFCGSDHKIHIYVKDEIEFKKAALLTGHEDWIRSIDLTVDDYHKSILVVSGAQDCLIRVWRIQESNHVDADVNVAQDEIQLNHISYIVKDESGASRSFRVKLDAIVAGHENWIYGLHWHPQIKNGTCEPKQLRFLSASMDKTMILWTYDTELSAWLETVRVGEVGGNTLGFYGCRMSPDGRFIIAHGYHGAFHLWRYDTGVQQWQPAVTVSGHFREVQDLAWDPDGKFIISVSSDQTTRLHAPLITADDKNSHWHEIARPQVHGYDMTSIAMLGRHRFASGADEKIVRSFEAPRNFLENFATLCGGNLGQTYSSSVPEGASVPSLGLSNKAVFERNPESEPGPKHPKDIYPESYFQSTTLTEPPTEELLLQNTLWPEVHKLYGHGYEIYCVAGNPQGTLLASACKLADHAFIILWETQTWSNVAQLFGHSLTVTQMAFSPCGKRLLSVSRDRTWSLYRLTWEPGSPVISEREAYSDKKTGVHARIIWTCAWLPNGKHFVTGSRDGKVVVWSRSGNESSADDANSASCLGNWKVISKRLDLDDSVTAVAVTRRSVTTNFGYEYIFAIGLEKGVILLYGWNDKDSSHEIWNCFAKLDNIHHHHAAVKRLSFNPKPHFRTSGEVISDVLQLASCGCDNAVRVTDILFA